MIVRCYGGCKHGTRVCLSKKQPYFHARKPRLEKQNWLYEDYVRPVEPIDEIDTYELDTYYERRGRCGRQMMIAKLEGRNLYREELWQIEQDIQEVKWEPLEEPDFMRDFDRWFAWRMYAHTGEQKYIQEELSWRGW